MAHKLITIHGMVADSWTAAHPDPPPMSAGSTISDLSGSDRIRLLGVTCDSQLNTWRAYDLAKDTTAKRLDYVFFNSQRATARDCTVVFTELVPGLNCSYSDHFGIHVQLELKNKLPKDDSEATFADENTLSPAIFDAIDHINERYLDREIRHSKYRIWHFQASVVAFVALLIGQWWVKPNYAHFLILLGAVVIMVTGCVDGLIGFVFGRWEVGALREFMSEVKMARKVYLE